MRYPNLISLLYFFLFNQTSLIIQSWLSTISIFQTLVIYHHSQKIIYIYMSRFRHFERKEKEWEKEICIYLILFPKSSKQSSKHNVHFTRLEGWKEELARRLSLHLPSLLSRKTTILASSCRSPNHPPGPRNRWRKTVGVASHRQLVSHATTYDVSLISRHRLVAEILALFHRVEWACWKRPSTLAT